MADFDRMLANTLKEEGGFTVDTGGRTNMGVTQDTYNAYAPKYNLPNQDVKKAKWTEVKIIYENEFYKNPKINTLPTAKLQEAVFDFGVNAGPATVIKALQHIVGSKVDGKIGNKTNKAVLDYIEKNGEERLLGEFLDARFTHYQRLVTEGSNKFSPEVYRKNWNGWMNRLTRQRDRLGADMNIQI